MKKKSRQQQKKKKILFSLFPASSFILVTLGAAVSHEVYSSVQTASLVNVRCVMCCRSGSRPLASATPSILDPH